MKKLIFSIVGFFMAVSVYAATCAELQASLQTYVTNNTASLNAAHDACIAGGHPPSVCGANNPGGEVQSQVYQGASQKRYHTWYTGPASEGSLFKEQFGPWTSCGDNVCAVKTGTPGITNWTVGYSRTPNADDLSMVGTVYKIPANRLVCDGGCVVEMTTGEKVWQSQTPTDQGLYRWSLDVTSIPTGATCTASAADAPANKATPNPVCPGYVGEINGVKGCYGTASAPVNTVQADRPSSTPQPGNPAAGEKPLTGEGSGSTGAGRTPAAGTGGPAGGPASAANNAAGNGTIPKPATDREQQACGAPGQPRCAIDEAGTPTGKGVLPTTEFEAKLQERENALTTVTSASGKDTTWGVMPQWTQGGTCSAWHMFTLPPVLGSYRVDIDVCPVKPFADGMANFIWISLAFMGITAMVFNTMTSKAN